MNANIAKTSRILDRKLIILLSITYLSPATSVIVGLYFSVPQATLLTTTFVNTAFMILLIISALKLENERLQSVAAIVGLILWIEGFLQFLLDNIFKALYIFPTAIGITLFMGAILENVGDGYDSEKW